MRRLPVPFVLVAVLAAQFVVAAPLHAASPYLLPVYAGIPVLTYQGNNSAYDHVAANGSQYAWDFTLGTMQFPVEAARGGTVIGARSDSTNTTCRSLACWTDANYVLIDHGDGTSALYLHLATGKVAVTVGQVLAQGTFLGTADSTGYSYGTHLHFMVEKTPTARTASGWWWTQSVAITFADAGLPLEGKSYTSQNVAATAVPSTAPANGSDILSAKVIRQGPDQFGRGYAVDVTITWVYGGIPAAKSGEGLVVSAFPVVTGTSTTTFGNEGPDGVSPTRGTGSTTLKIIRSSGPTMTTTALQVCLLLWMNVGSPGPGGGIPAVTRVVYCKPTSLAISWP